MEEKKQKKKRHWFREGVFRKLPGLCCGFPRGKHKHGYSWFTRDPTGGGGFSLRRQRCRGGRPKRPTFRGGPPFPGPEKGKKRGSELPARVGLRASGNSVPTSIFWGRGAFLGADKFCVFNRFSPADEGGRTGARGYGNPSSRPSLYRAVQPRGIRGETNGGGDRGWGKSQNVTFRGTGTRGKTAGDP